MYNNALIPQGISSASEEVSGQGLMRSINLRDLWAPIYRSRIAVIAIFVAVFSLAIAATLLIQPRYRATATVEIRSEAQKVLGTEDNENSSDAVGTGAQMFLDTQIDIIRSRATASAVAQSLGLYNNDRFLAAMSVKTDNRIEGTQTPEQRRKLVNQVLLDGLSVSFTRATRIAKIEFSSPDPRLAQQIANSFADNYIKLNLARRFDASSYSLDFLRNQIREAQERLSRSEREAIGYARNQQLIDASNAATSSSTDSGPQSLTTASLVSLNQALAEATTKRIAAEQRWRTVQAAPLMTVPEVASNPSVQQLQQQRALLQAQYEQELQTRTQDYPTVRQLAARVKELNSQISSIASNVRSTIREEYVAARAQEEGLSRNINQLKTTTLDEQSRGIQLSILRREANTNRQQLDALLKRYNELNAQSGVQLNNLSVIDTAETPGRPYWPSVPLNVALALILSLLLSAIYVLGRENLFEMVRTPEDVGARLHLPLLGAIPADDNINTSMTDPKSSVSEALNSIRTSLSLSSANGAPRSFTVTSTQAGEGKSTACFGLAQGLAKIGRSVIIVDADLRRPNIHRLIGVKNEAGVSNILTGAETIDRCVRVDAAGNVDVIVAGPIPPDAAELLAGNRFRALIEELATRYDHVLVDSAPVLGLADAPLVASSVEGVVYVVEAGRNGVRAVQSAINRLQQSGTPLIGVVLSRFDPGKAGYSYEYRYAYEYSYGVDKKVG